ncbi:MULTISPECIES: motility associated factor glycosyltransferase family protein [Lysinibacillus]|uniref:Motility associated factor glycosyltransferase family protein n=1 Tax=Lysinibacillus xylanilyticus TaxID=582475 RepID=A0ABV3VWZ4_9BACI
MKFEILKAKNGENTLKVNNLFLYGKYRPVEDASRFIDKEYDKEAKGYLLVGLGLGYHLMALHKLIEPHKELIVFVLNKKEKDFFKDSEIERELRHRKNIKLIYNISDLVLNTDYQIIIPHVWLSVMGQDHPLYSFFMDIKIKQMSYKRFAPLLEQNFKINIQLDDFKLMRIKESIKDKKIAALVSSGPSLNETKNWLKNIKEDIFILSVGSALKPLLNAEVTPHAVIISDPQPLIMKQFSDIQYNGDLFYLCTADNNTVNSHKHNRCVLLQNGYPFAEKLAAELKYPTLDTGGSVATLAFSLLEYIGFEQVILFGQDLGFTGSESHVSGSTSGRNVGEAEKLLMIECNADKVISTTNTLYSYLKWFNNAVQNTSVEVYNTALYGAKIEGSQFLNEQQFCKLFSKGSI